MIMIPPSLTEALNNSEDMEDTPKRTSRRTTHINSSTGIVFGPSAIERELRMNEDGVSLITLKKRSARSVSSTRQASCQKLSSALGAALISFPWTPIKYDAHKVAHKGRAHNKMASIENDEPSDDDDSFGERRKAKSSNKGAGEKYPGRLYKKVLLFYILNFLVYTKALTKKILSRRHLI